MIDGNNDTVINTIPGPGKSPTFILGPLGPPYDDDRPGYKYTDGRTVSYIHYNEPPIGVGFRSSNTEHIQHVYTRVWMRLLTVVVEKVFFSDLSKMWKAR